MDDELVAGFDFIKTSFADLIQRNALLEAELERLEDFEKRLAMIELAFEARLEKLELELEIIRKNSNGNRDEVLEHLKAACQVLGKRMHQVEVNCMATQKALPEDGK